MDEKQNGKKGTKLNLQETNNPEKNEHNMPDKVAFIPAFFRLFPPVFKTADSHFATASPARPAFERLRA